MHSKKQKIYMACLCITLVAAIEQTMLCSGSYITLHGLKNNAHNGSEGMMVGKEDAKIKVQMAGHKDHQGAR